MPEELLEEKIQNEMAQKIARAILGMTQVLLFPAGGVPVKVAATVYGKSELWVRAGIEEGWLPIGVCTKTAGRTNYYISPKKLYEDTGYLWKGEK